MPNHPRGPNLIVGTREEIIALKFVVLPGMPEGSVVKARMYLDSDHSKPITNLEIPEGYIYHPSYVEVDAQPGVEAELVCRRNEEEVFGGQAFDLTRIARDEMGIVEVGEPIMFKASDRMEFYIRTKKTNGADEILGEALVHLIEVPEEGRG